MSLKKQAFSSVRWTAIATTGKVGLQFLQVIVFARVLTPADFGVMALLVAMIVFVQIFSDMGISGAIIHCQTISQKQLSSLYWLNVCAGGILMLILMVLSFPIAEFYHKASLQPLLLMVSTCFLINALGQQLRVVAEKELNFSSLAKTELVAASIGAATAITWVLLSPSLTAFVGGLIANALMMTMLCWLILAKGWRPEFRMHFGEIRDFLSFGGYTMANNVVNSINSQADIFIGGRMISTESLGLYSLPRDLSLRLASAVNPIVTRVGLPVMAKAQHDVDFLKRVYLKTLRMTASINFPLYLVLVMFAPEILLLIFGSQWDDAAPLLRVLGLWGMFRAIGSPVGSLLYATGRADLSFKWNLSLLFIVIPMLCFAVQWGAMGMAIGLTCLGVVSFIPGWFFLVRPLCGARLWEYTLNVLAPLCAALIASIVAYLSVMTLSEPLARLCFGVVVGGGIYIVVSIYINKQWVDSMRELFSRT